MKTRTGSRALVLFYILVFYVLLQFGWWAYLLMRTNNQVAIHQNENLKHQIAAAPDLYSPEEVAEKQKQLDQDLHKRWLMIIGEGGVFLILLGWAIVRTRNGFRQEAFMAERQKNFLLSITHELRSPLASIGLQAETLIKRELPKEKQNQILSDVLEDTERLNTLIGNILLAARIDNHAYVLQKTEQDISTYITQLTGKIASGAGQHHKFVTDIDRNITLNYDPVAAHSVFINLIENAIKYSPAGKTISVALRRENNTVIFSVTDQGAGISDADKKNIFSRFYRSGNEETRSSKGTGLGLYITKQLADMHNWKLSVSGQAGIGSTFTVIMPSA